MSKNIFRQITLRILAVLLIISVLLPINTSAAVLGTQTEHNEMEFAQGTVYIRNTFISDQASVGKQTENIFSYTPNSDVIPIIYNGTSVYGKRTLTQAESILNSAGINTAMGMNADFFSFKTGVPMSNTIIDGEILTKDTSCLSSVGFNDDGTAFISPLSIKTTLTTDTNSFPVECINKFRQPYFVYLFDSRYGDKTMSEGWGINVTLGNVSGSFKLNSNMTAVVEDVSEGDNSVPIPNGKIILSVSADAPQELKDRLYSLSVGQNVTLNTCLASDDTRWLNAGYGIGCTGGTLITNGELNFTEESAAPRTALGIKADGTIILYTLDGRQSGYSFGARKETLAQRLLELGCVDAVNLDGGGSTTIGGVYPGTTDFKVLNSPSEGSLRACANFIFLKKQNPYTGVPYKMFVSPYGKWLLSGATTQITAELVDSAYGKANAVSPVIYSIADGTTASGSTIDSSGFLTVEGDGDIYISAVSGDINGGTLIHSVKTPDSIAVISEDTGNGLNTITIKRGESINLTATAYLNGVSLSANDYCFNWSVANNDGEIGTIDNVGFFTASNMKDAKGLISVSAGGFKKDIPVSVVDEEIDANDGMYPKIEGGFENGVFSATITGIRSEIKKQNITLRIDGTDTKFDFDTDTNTLTYAFLDEDEPHRIAVAVTDDLGYSTLSHFDAGDISSLGNAFPDTQNHWAKQYISYLAQHNIVKGLPNDFGQIEFMPGKSMNRAELACMLCNYLKIDISKYSDVNLPYADLGDIPSWALGQAKALYSLGIMKGQLIDDKTYFSPGASLSRLEFAIAVSRLMPKGLNPAEINFTDASEVPWWAVENMQTVIGQGVMGGYPDGTLRPQQSVTRAEACKMLYFIF